MPPLDSPPSARAARSPDFEKFAFSPEFQLLLACCSVPGNESDGRRVRVEASLDWSHVLRFAEHHNVMPLVYQALRQIPDEVPPTTLDELRTRFERNARKNLRFTAKLIRILECLESHGIAAIPFKGPALAEAVYGNLALREFSDLDILVRPADFLRAKEALRSLAYVPGWQLSAVEESAYLATGYECSFDGPAGRNLLELQWGVLSAFYAVDFDIEGFFQRAACNKFGDGTVKTLSQQDLLLTLCMHAAKHAWIRLCWLRDIAGVSRSPSLDWNGNRGIVRKNCAGHDGIRGVQHRIFELFPADAAAKRASIGSVPICSAASFHTQRWGMVGRAPPCSTLPAIQSYPALSRRWQIPAFR